MRSQRLRLRLQLKLWLRLRLRLIIWFHAGKAMIALCIDRRAAVCILAYKETRAEKPRCPAARENRKEKSASATSSTLEPFVNQLSGLLLARHPFKFARHLDSFNVDLSAELNVFE